MLNIKCDNCDEELTEPGALWFGPPNKSGLVTKSHMCVRCYNNSDFTDIEWDLMIEALTMAAPNEPDMLQLIEKIKRFSQ